MSFVHANSCECMKSELDIFSLLPTQTSIESGGYKEYNPISALADGAPIEFSISGAGQEYIDLSNTLLYVKAKIARADNTNIDNTNHVGPINLLLHSLFSEVDVSLNGVQINASNNMYAYRAYIETLLTYGQNAKQSQLSASMFYKDVAAGMENANPHQAAAVNLGFVKRHSFFENGAEVDMIGGLHSDIFLQNKYLMSDVTLNIKLTRQKTDAFCLMSSEANAAYKVKILACNLIVRKVKLSPSIYMGHAKALEESTAKYPIRRVVCKSFSVPAGNLDFTQEKVFSGQLPSRIVVGCVDSTALNGSYDRNPFNFKNYRLNHININLDGLDQNVREYEPNFGANQYIEAYMGMYTGTSKYRQDEGNEITREDFPRGYALYVFDLTPDLADQDHFNLIHEGSLRLVLKFGAALLNTINVVVYAEFQNIIEIDRNRNILKEFTT